MKKIATALGIALGISLGALHSYAQQAVPAPERRAMGSQDRRGPVVGLGLTPEQRAKLMEIRRDFMKENAQAMGLKEPGEHGEELNPTPEQKAKSLEMHRSFMKENAQSIGSLVGKRIELRALWSDPKSEDKAIMDREKEAWVLLGQLREKRIEMKLAMRKLLTPDQIEHWKPRWGMGKTDAGWGACWDMDDDALRGHPGLMGPPGMTRGRAMRPGLPPGPTEE